jgi:hypothetical protein
MSSDGYELLCLENPLLDILGTNGPTNMYHAKNCHCPRVYPTTSNSTRKRHQLIDGSDESMLKKYDIKANDAILAEDKHKDIFEER